MKTKICLLISAALFLTMLSFVGCGSEDSKDNTLISNSNINNFANIVREAAGNISFDTGAVSGENSGNAKIKTVINDNGAVSTQIEFIDFSKNSKLVLNGKLEYTISAVSGSWLKGDSSALIIINGEVETSGEYSVLIVYKNFSIDLVSGASSGDFYVQNKDGSKIDFGANSWNIFITPQYDWSDGRKYPADNAGEYADTL